MTRLKVETPSIEPSEADLISQAHDPLVAALLTVNRRLDRIEAQLGLDPLVPAVAPVVDRRWPPDRVDLNDPYWEWMPLKKAVPFVTCEERQLRTIQSEVGLPVGGRWYISVRRYYQPR